MHSDKLCKAAGTYSIKLESMTISPPLLKSITGITVIIVVVLVCSLSRLWDKSINNLPDGEGLASYDSPDGHYRVSVYLCSGDMSDFAIRAAVRNNNANFLWEMFPRNIYWDYHQYEARVLWLNNKMVKINGRVLDIENGDYFDWRSPMHGTKSSREK